MGGNISGRVRVRAGMITKTEAAQLEARLKHIEALYSEMNVKISQVMVSVESLGQIRVSADGRVAPAHGHIQTLRRFAD